ncbi:hypothetical protein J2046_006452 [Rhizobium petrolearium]|uniref:hypothetical protein n=1 Tax=Hyphomicrobiales TaxID=356 RepID=UPI001AEB4D1A|nr:hypothetical protein [Neorhizobium petrolearium]MBP1848162.1 hypothetical protein [Neorhizobium petrolearium]
MTAFTRTLLMFRIGLSRQTTAYSPKLTAGLRHDVQEMLRMVRAPRPQPVGQD